VGCEAGHAGFTSRPRVVLPGPRWPPAARLGLGPARLCAAVSGVGEKLPVDDVADAPLEGAERFLLRLGLGQLALVVDAAGVIVGDLGEGCGVDGVVDLPVASGVEPVAGLGTRGRFGGAVPLWRA